MRQLNAFLRDTRGATAIEYALIAGFISILVVAGATSIGTKLSASFVKIANNLS
jgi:pilus assembly protein Flp/PilA